MNPNAALYKTFGADPMMWSNDVAHQLCTAFARRRDIPAANRAVLGDAATEFEAAAQAASRRDWRTSITREDAGRAVLTRAGLNLTHSYAVTVPLPPPTATSLWEVNARDCLVRQRDLTSRAIQFGPEQAHLAAAYIGAAHVMECAAQAWLARDEKSADQWRAAADAMIGKHARKRRDAVDALTAAPLSSVA